MAIRRFGETDTAQAGVRSDSVSRRIPVVRPPFAETILRAPEIEARIEPGALTASLIGQLTALCAGDLEKPIVVESS